MKKFFKQLFCRHFYILQFVEYKTDLSEGEDIKKSTYTCDICKKKKITITITNLFL